jgi:hypothetical protein
MLTYGDCINFIKMVYNDFNGEINPVVPAIRLALTEPNPNTPKEFSIAGSQCMMYIEVRLDIVYELFNKSRLSDDQIRGGLLYIVLHELSHCDQKIIPNKQNDIDYVRYVEYTNNLNTFAFIKKNWNLLKCCYGNFEIPEIVYGSYLAQREFYNGQVIIFPQISSIKEKVLDGISVLINEDVYTNIYPSVNNINLSVFVGQNLYDEFEIIQNKNLVCTHSAIIRISQFIARAIYDYRRSCVINGDTCEMTLYLPSTPEYHVTILK